MTLRFGLPHGIACSFTLPMVLERARGDRPGPRRRCWPQIFDGDLAAAPRRLREFLRRRGGQDRVRRLRRWTRQTPRRMVAHALEGVRGKNFIGSGWTRSNEDLGRW
jgi:hypothetical protein